MILNNAYRQVIKNCSPKCEHVCYIHMCVYRECLQSGNRRVFGLSILKIDFKKMHNNLPTNTT